VSASLRPVESSDLATVLTMNNAAVPAVNELGLDDLEWFAEHAGTFLVIDGDPPGGFLIGLHGPGLDYASDNYRWFSERYESFVYVDRIVIAEAGRGAGSGRRLYDAFARRGRTDGAEWLLAEVNTRPRNDASLRFHERYGFRTVGAQDTDGGAKSVALLACALTGNDP